MVVGYGTHASGMPPAAPFFVPGVVGHAVSRSSRDSRGPLTLGFLEPGDETYCESKPLSPRQPGCLFSGEARAFAPPPHDGFALSWALILYMCWLCLRSTAKQTILVQPSIFHHDSARVPACGCHHAARNHRVPVGQLQPAAARSVAADGVVEVADQNHQMIQTCKHAAPPKTCPSTSVIP